MKLLVAGVVSRVGRLPYTLFKIEAYRDVQFWNRPVWRVASGGDW